MTRWRVCLGDLNQLETRVLANWSSSLRWSRKNYGVKAFWYKTGCSLHPSSISFSLSLPFTCSRLAAWCALDDEHVFRIQPPETCPCYHEIRRGGKPRKDDHFEPCCNHSKAGKDFTGWWCCSCCHGWHSWWRVEGLVGPTGRVSGIVLSMQLLFVTDILRCFYSWLMQFCTFG